LVEEGLDVEGMYLEEEEGILLDSSKRELGVSQVGSDELSETEDSSVAHVAVGTEVLEERLDLVLAEDDISCDRIHGDKARSVLKGLAPKEERVHVLRRWMTRAVER